MDDASPTARSLALLELVQARPGIAAADLAERLGVSERAVRRHVETLRRAGIPIESTRGRYGGYRAGRGLRLPPLMFTGPEALGLVMAVLEGRGDTAADPDADEPVATALHKIVRVLPASLATAARAVREVSTAYQPTGPRVDPETVAALVQAAAAGRRVRIGYAPEARPERPMEIDPWAVVLRRQRWYVLGWSHTVSARRVLRIDRVGSVRELDEPFEPPAGLDPVAVVDEHLSEGWAHDVELVVDAPPAYVARFLPRTHGRLEPLGGDRTRVVGSTNDPGHYAARLAFLGVPFQVVSPVELRDACLRLSETFRAAAG
ncbi:helix-turn-helix transcriptional regulator [Nocardioides sp.]|uniref:helix-turn-helix transcriptional regulator n=1 Tax=Nocardioides sp. TaxID=35761 RepID=UPI0035284077